MIFKILIIDDDYINRHLLVSLLKKELYQVNIIESVDGKEALDICHQHADIQLILLDVEMPRMDGADFLKYYMKDKDLKKVPVIAVSSNDLRIKEILKAGADSFLVKPVTEEKLLKAIHQASQKS